MARGRRNICSVSCIQSQWAGLSTAFLINISILRFLEWPLPLVSSTGICVTLEYFLSGLFISCPLHMVLASGRPKLMTSHRRQHDLQPADRLPRQQAPYSHLPLGSPPTFTCVPPSPIYKERPSGLPFSLRHHLARPPPLPNKPLTHGTALAGCAMLDASHYSNTSFIVRNYTKGLNCGKLDCKQNLR